MLRSFQRSFSAVNSMHEHKLVLLQKCVDLVPKHGWGLNTISLACRELGYPPSMNGLIGGNAVDLITYFQLMTLDKLKQKHHHEDPSSGTHSFYDRLDRILRDRIDLVKPFAPHLPQAIKILSDPVNIATSAEIIQNNSHELCRLAGDESYNMKWYSRRAAVSAICSTSDLFLTADQSPEKSDTVEFLARRVREAAAVEAKADHLEVYGRMLLTSVSNILPQLR